MQKRAISSFQKNDKHHPHCEMRSTANKTRMLTFRGAVRLLHDGIRFLPLGKQGPLSYPPKQGTMEGKSLKITIGIRIKSKQSPNKNMLLPFFFRNKMSQKEHGLVSPSQGKINHLSTAFHFTIFANPRTSTSSPSSTFVWRPNFRPEMIEATSGRWVETRGRTPETSSYMG